MGRLSVAPHRLALVADQLIIRGAREHNLKDVSLDLPRDALIVFTGLSGSGKSSLAFDTIFAEGQRRYVESLSAYARQFLGQMDKPDVDFIEGLSPAVSIDQKSTSKNPRSTVGTITEVYDYLRLLYARAGRPHCPTCGAPIERQTPQQIVDRVMALEEGRRFQVLAPVIRGRKGEYVELFRQLQTQGFSRARVNGETHPLDDPPTLDKQKKHTIEVVVDRLAVKASSKRRLTDSVETALGLAGGLVVFDFVDLAAKDPGRELKFSERMACPNDHPIETDDLEPRSFSFNSPFGACPACHGLGTRMEVDPELVVPDPGRHPGRGRDRAVEQRPRGRLLPQAAQRAGRGARLRPEHALGGPPRQGPEVDPRRSPDQGARGHHQPLRPPARLLRRVRGRAVLHRASAPRGRVRHQPGALRGLHARGGLPGLRGQPAQAGVARRDAARPRRRPQHRRGVRAADQRDRRVPARSRPDHPRAPDRRAGAQGDPGAAQLPARRRSRLPLPRPALGLAVRGRGAADPAGHPDRRRPRRRPLRPRRALDRAPPARQQAAHRDAGPAQGPRQHPDRRRARRGHDPHGRLGGRHRPGRRRARRPGRAQRHRAGPARPRRLDDRAVPLRSARDPDAARPPPAHQESSAHRARRPRAQPARRHRLVPARPVRRGDGGLRLGQVDPGQRHPLHVAGQADLQRPRRAGPAHEDHRGRRRSTR